jgi:hypothetical protein
VRFHHDIDVFAFMGRPSEQPRKLTYANLKVRSTATPAHRAQEKVTPIYVTPPSKVAFAFWADSGISRSRPLIGSRVME